MWAVRSRLPSPVLRRYQRCAGMLVVPERTAAKQQEQRENRELGSGDPLLTAFAVVPGEHEDDRQSDEKRERDQLLDLAGPVVGAAEVLEALQESPGRRDVDNAPLHHLAAGRSGPGAFALPLARVAHAVLPVATECSGITSRRSLECPVPGRSGHDIKDRSWPIFAPLRMSAPVARCRHRDRPPSPAVGGVSNGRQAAIFNPTEIPALAHRPTR